MEEGWTKIRHISNERNHSADSNIGRHGSTVDLDGSNSSCPAGEVKQRRLPPRRGRVVNSGRLGSNVPPEFTTIILNEIMTALELPDIGILGIHGSINANRENVVEKVTRRIERDELFNVVVETSVTKKPDLKRIQEELGKPLGLQLHKKTPKERATLLCERIKREDKILIILRDLQHKIDLAEIGIPFGNDHKGCKILLVAENKKMLSHKTLKTQKQIYVDHVEPKIRDLTRSHKVQTCVII
ncbi:hypothetical protein D0Y65_017187 [Glycine soja]|nr:hypothetical protein D0Y65_017187 [Glycine soja]